MNTPDLKGKARMGMNIGAPSPRIIPGLGR